MQMCSNCFKSKNYCTCTSLNTVDIDIKMYSTIKTLNLKGFITNNCCSGHDLSDYIFIYVLFDHRYNLEPPIPFKMRVIKTKTQIYYSETIKDIKQRRKVIKSMNLVLKIWSKNLKKEVDKMIEKENYTAVYSDSAFTGIGIVKIYYDINDKIKVQRFQNDKVCKPNIIRLYSNGAGSYFVLSGVRYYVKDFLRTDIGK